MKKLILFIACGFGSGYLPKMPGTWGTIFALIVYLTIPESFWMEYYAVVMVTLLFFTGVYISGKAEAYLSHDDGRIVIDEIAGFFVSVLFLPKIWYFYIPAFILFRLYDILKPWPINKLQSLKGGWGVMVDDIVAGVYTAVILHLSWFMLRVWLS
ncbi:MAG: phosphatidylglycerophosphatase A [Candidatus Cloacimonetes bacterium]|nr:phosphatidylglycerophosphatase A [Candidatus Cloacimonadota bacterium]